MTGRLSRESAAKITQQCRHILLTCGQLGQVGLGTKSHTQEIPEPNKTAFGPVSLNGKDSSLVKAAWNLVNGRHSLLLATVRAIGERRGRTQGVSVTETKGELRVSYVMYLL